MRNSRLDGFGKMVSEVNKDDLPRQAVLGRLRAATKVALENLPKLMGGVPA